MAEITGTYMTRPLSAFAQDCEAAIVAEHDKITPDPDLIALLCDAVRLQREMVEVLDARNQLLQWLIEARAELRRLRDTPCHTSHPAAVGD